MVWKSAPLNARSAEFKRDGSLKPDLSGARILYVGLKGCGNLGIGTGAICGKVRDHLTGGATPPSAIAVNDLDSGVVVPAYLCAY